MKKNYKILIIFLLSIIFGTCITLILNTYDNILLLNPPFYLELLITLLISSIYFLVLISFLIISYSKKYKMIHFLFYSQLILNILLTYYFLKEWTFYQLIITLILMIETIINISLFSQLKKVAALINIPYFIYLIIIFYVTIKCI